MPLDPGVAQLLAMLEASGRPPMTEGTPEQARAGFRVLTVDLRSPEHVVPVGETRDLRLPGPAGELDARLYRPEADGPLPTVVFFHGGGFVIGDLDTHDNQCRTVCREVEAVVLSVAYRVAPEAPFPAAVEDCWAALAWAAEHVEELGDDPARLAVAGDSAGGNLAAACAQLAVAHGGPALAAQLLVYPATHAAGEYPSRAENAEGYFLTLAEMEWFDGHYVADRALRDDPRYSVLLAPDLAGLPPAVVVTAEYDPLRDEGEAYARALEAAGVPVVLHRFPGLIHGFFDLGHLSPAAAEAVRTTCAELRALLPPA